MKIQKHFIPIFSLVLFLAVGSADGISHHSTPDLLLVVRAAIYGHRLEKFLDRNTPIPLQFSSLEDQLHQILSEEFLQWRQQDQILVSWLHGSLSDSFLTRVVGCKRSWQIWSKIQDYVVSMTRATAFQLKIELRNTSKGNRSISECLLRIKAIVDQQISIGHLVSEHEHLEVILEVLPAEYNAFVASILSWIDPYCISKLETLLMTLESRLEKQAGSTPLDLL